MAIISSLLELFTSIVSSQRILSTEIAKKGSKIKKVYASTVRIYTKWKASYIRLVKSMSLISKISN